MSCVKCGEPNERVLCPVCVAKLCCSKRSHCVHRPPRNAFARRAIAAAALMMAASCSAGSGGPSQVASPPSTQASAPGVPRPYALRGAAEGYSATTTSARPNPPPRASRSKTTVRPRAAVSPPARRPAVVSNGDVFDALARCESGMRRVTPGPYHSYFQWTLGTWHSLGFSGIPEDYDYATQKAAAQRLVARSGWGQFPACSRKIGAR